MTATAAPIPAALATQVAGSSFYAGMRILPAAERAAMFAIYAFCRQVDDIADDQQTPRDQRGALLDQWRQDIAALYRAPALGHADATPASTATASPPPPTAAAHNQAAFLAEPIRRFALAEADFIAVIDGMEMDVTADIRVPDDATLDLYCDRVASAVGRLSVRVFGMAPAPGEALAHHLGRALQLTNILRDIDEDAAINRVYLPAEAFAAAGFAPGEAAATAPLTLAADPRTAAAARWLAPRAEAHFAAAARILKTRPKGRLAAPRLMEAAYARLLRQMIATGWAPPRQRIKVAKLRLALAALWLWLRG